MQQHRSLGKRRFVLAAAATYCGSRAIAYGPWSERVPQEAILLGTAGGVLLPVFVVAWLAAAVVALWCLRSGRIIVPLSLTVGLMTGWGAMWAIGWLAFPTTLWWQTALTYAGPAGMIAGLTVLTPRSPEPEVHDED